jgi:putative molybdopterin biosynthesis protein
MSEFRLDNTVRAHRDRLGLSQQELAALVGVSRQAIIAIEGGRQVPSTSLALRLAQALRCDVEDLFQLSTGGGLTVRLAPPTRESDEQAVGGARVSVGEVSGRWVAHRLPPDPTQSADALISREIGARTAVVEPLTDADRLRHNVLVSGCAPILGTLVQRLGRERAQLRATWLPASSFRSLDLLGEGLIHVAGAHFSMAAGGEDNVAAVRRSLPGRGMLIVNLTRWRQGFVVQAGNPRGIASAGDLLRPDLRLAMREEGSAAHKLLTVLLERERAERTLLRGPSAAGHTEVAQLVRSGAADVGVAIEGVALAAGLDFVPLTEERFDLLVPAEIAEWAPLARLLDAVGSTGFRAEIAQLPGYDQEITGHVTTLEAA